MRVLVCGDAMTDLYYWGDAKRISPEAPVPVVSVQKVETRQGAACNVARNIEAMGVQVERLYGGGERIQKIRVLVKNQQVARVDFDYPQNPILPDATYLDALSRCDIIVFMDYGKGSLVNIQALITAAKGKTILVDPKGHDYNKYRGATLIKPNGDEMKDLVGGWSTPEELDFKARQFLLASGIDSILLTQSADGMTLYTKDATNHFPSEAKEVVDVSGAGEAALSAFAAAFAKGFTFIECAKYAAKASGISVGFFGTTVIEEKDLFDTENPQGQESPTDRERG